MHKCDWCLGDELYENYHDTEWGVPLYEDQKIFEFLILEGFQAGLSWISILRKRENFRAAFDNFNPGIIASYTPEKEQLLLQNSGIIRNKLKVKAAISNAQAYLNWCEKNGEFGDFFWDFVDGQPLQNAYKSLDEVPPFTPLSEKISKQLKQLGFRFVGPTVVYAHMQAMGMVNDHLVGCFRHAEVEALKR
ncbi:MAG: DNA-3-methyladenine glycosylase I [Flavobacteriaceae bacterium]